MNKNKFNSSPYVTNKFKNDMNFIMENWRKFEKDFSSSQDFEILKESKMYIKKNKKQLFEGKDKNPFKEVMTFENFIDSVKNNKINLNEARTIFFDTIDHDGRLLEEAVLSDIGSAIKTGAQKVGGAIKTGAKIAGQMTGAVLKGMADLAKKIIFGALTLIGNIITGAINVFKKAVSNPKEFVNELKSKKSGSQITNILKSVGGKILQYIKDNKWKIVATVAVVILLAVTGVIFLKMSLSAAVAAGNAVAKCGKAAIDVGTSAVKTAKALAAATPPAPLQEAAAAFCRIVGSNIKSSLDNMLLSDKSIDTFIGALNESGENLQATKEIAIQSQTGDNVPDEEMVSITNLSEKTLTLKVEAIEMLKSVKSGALSASDFKQIASENQELSQFLSKAADNLIQNGCKDPAKLEMLRIIGEKTKVYVNSHIQTELIISSTQVGDNLAEEIVKEFSKNVATTVVDVGRP